MFEWVKLWSKDLFKSLLTLLQDVFYWLIDTVMGAAVSLFQALGSLPGTEFIGSAWQSLPSEIRDMALRVGLAEVSTILVSALLIRFIIQMIPFVRWGS